MTELASQVTDIKQRFLHYGFLASPLTTREIVKLLRRGKSQDDVYNIGCDVACGYSWSEALQANKPFIKKLEAQEELQRSGMTDMQKPKNYYYYAVTNTGNIRPSGFEPHNDGQAIAADVVDWCRSGNFIRYNRKKYDKSNILEFLHLFKNWT